MQVNQSREVIDRFWGMQYWSIAYGRFHYSPQDKHLIQFFVLICRLLQRKNFLEVPWLNLFGVAWVQFMVHDWFDHGTPISENRMRVPLQQDDPLHSKMKGK